MNEHLSRRAVRTTFAIVVSTALSAWATASFAQSTEASASRYLEDLSKCRMVSNDESRLRCYDTASAIILDAEEKGDLKIVDRQQADRARRSLFGFKLPSISLFDGKGDQSAQVSEIESVVKSVRDLGRGRYLIGIEEDDATWQTTEASPFFRSPEKGATINIERGALGSFFLKVDGGKKVRAKRVE